MKLCLDELQIIVETTGGYNSSVNGKVERPHQTIKNMVRVQLISRGHDDELWCLTYQYTIWIIARLYHSRIKTAPIVAWHKHKGISFKIDLNELVIWGCKIYIINSKQAKKALDPRTAKDPRHMAKYLDPAQLPATADGFFMGYSSTTKVILYFDPATRRIKRTFHCYIDEYDVKLHPNESQSIGALHLREYPDGTPAPVSQDHPNLRLVQSTFDIVASPFHSDDLLELELTVPPSGTAMDITIADDPIHQIPYISSIPMSSPIADQFPAERRHGLYIGH